MRKHFLLFLLTVLLPLAGWAEDLSNASVAVGNIVKGTGATGAPFVVWEGETLTGTGEHPHYQVDPKYYKKVGDEYAAIVGELSAQPVGTYYVKIVGVPENGFNGEAYGAFEITKKPLTIDFNAVAATYGDEPTAITYTVYDGETPLAADNAIVTGLGIHAVTKSGANEITITKTTDKGSYDFAFTYTTTGDYTLTSADVNEDGDKYVISAKPITAAMVEMGTAGTYNYTGNAIEGLPTFTVTDGTANVTTFNVKWFAAPLVGDPETSDDDAVTPKNARTYYARVTGTGNYDGKVFDNDNWKITVNRVPLTVLVNPKSKTYDGVAYTAADVEYTFGGLVDADQGKIDLTTLTPKVGGLAWADFKDYKAEGYVISVDVTGAQIGTGEAAIALNTNYTVAPVPSTWTINKKEGLTISAANQQINFNAEIPATSDITVAGAVNNTEKEAIKAYYTAPKAEGAKNNAYGIQTNIYTPALVGDEHPYLANYADPAIVAGSLSVGAANATIMPIVASAIYDGKGHLATGYSATSGEYVLTADDIEGTPSYKYKKQDPETLAWSEWDENLVPTAVGVYRAVVKSTSVKGKGSFANAVFNKPEVQFEIQAKPIEVTVNNVTLHKGDTETTLNAHATVTDAYKASLVTGETLEFSFKFDPAKVGADKTLVIGEGGKISQGTGFAAENKAIIAELKNGAYNDNYDITFVAGNLIFGASELVLDPTDPTLATQIAEAAATGEGYNVTFANLTMKANEWYAMVLPFEVDPKEMVYEADRYVIFNELNKKSTTAGNFKFTLTMDKIPAGTPFLIKFAGEADEVIDFSEIDDNDTPANLEDDFQKFSFEGVDIDATINTVKTDYVNLTGTYASDVELQGSRTNGSENYVWWLCDTEYNEGAKGNNWLKPISKPHKVAPMEAWLDGNESAWTGYAPIITVEDFDGQTTSIQTLNAGEINGLNVANEGWYTINGVKLESAPTQKGIYIFNGKKVAVQ